MSSERKRGERRRKKWAVASSECLFCPHPMSVCLVYFFVLASYRTESQFSIVSGITHKTENSLNLMHAHTHLAGDNLKDIQ